jgi:hypothetical protein
MDTLKEKNFLEELWTSGKAPWTVDEPKVSARKELRAV